MSIVLNSFEKYGEYYTSIFTKHLKNQTEIRQHFEWLQTKLITNATIYMAMKAYKDAWKLWREAHNRKVGTPRFKHKDWFGSGSMRLSNGYDAGKPADMYSGSARVLDKNHVSIPKLGRIRVSHLAGFLRKHNADIIRIGTVTVSKDNLGYYWISFQLASAEPFTPSFKKTGSQLGIDLNTDNFLTDSNGNRIENPRFYQNAEKHLDVEVL